MIFSSFLISLRACRNVSAFFGASAYSSEAMRFTANRSAARSKSDLLFELFAAFANIPSKAALFRIKRATCTDSLAETSALMSSSAWAFAMSAVSASDTKSFPFMHLDVIKSRTYGDISSSGLFSSSAETK